MYLDEVHSLPLDEAHLVTRLDALDIASTVTECHILALADKLAHAEDRHLRWKDVHWENMILAIDHDIEIHITSVRQRCVIGGNAPWSRSVGRIVLICLAWEQHLALRTIGASA